MLVNSGARDLSRFASEIKRGTNTPADGLVLSCGLVCVRALCRAENKLGSHRGDDDADARGCVRILKNKLFHIRCGGGSRRRREFATFAQWRRSEFNLERRNRAPKKRRSTAHRSGRLQRNRLIDPACAACDACVAIETRLTL